MQIWDTASWTQKATLTGHGGVGAMAIAPDGTWLATATAGRCGSGTPPAGPRKPPSPATSDRVSAMAITPDGTWLATTGDAFSGGTVRIWDTATLDPESHPHRPRGQGERDGDRTRRHLARHRHRHPHRSSGTGPVRIWDTASWTQKATLTGRP